MLVIVPKEALFFKKRKYMLWILFKPRHRKWRGYYVIPSEIVSVRTSIRQSFHHLYLLHTVQNIFTKLHTNVKHYDTTCRTHEL